MDETTTPAEIRDARPDDRADLEHLAWLLWDRHHERSPARFRTADEITAAAEPQPPPFQLAARTWVSEVSGRVIGYVKTVLRDAPQSLAYRPQRVVIITEICILPEFRRHGIGRAFMEVVEAWARESLAEAVEVPVFGFNEDAIALYRTMGFEPWFLQLRRDLKA